MLGSLKMTSFVLKLIRMRINIINFAVYGKIDSKSLGDLIRIKSHKLILENLPEFLPYNEVESFYFL